MKTGSDNIGSLFLGTEGIGKAYLGNELAFDANARHLPSRYKECEYIDSVNYGAYAAYIKTGVLTSSELRIVIKAYGEVSDGWCFLFGAQPNSQTNMFDCYSYNDKVHSFKVYGSSFGSGYITNVAGIYEIDINKHRLIYNGVTYTSETSDSWQNNLEMPICALNDNGSFNGGAHAKIYYAKIYDGDDLIRDYVPAYDTVAQKYGLYDFVNGTFTSSANTRTQFTGVIK